MTEFLQAIRSDLFSRRLLPMLALLGVALIVAVAYALSSGSGSSAPPISAGAPVASSAGSGPVLPVTAASSNPDQAVAETPGGVRFQSAGPTRDPFVALPSPPAAKTASSSSGAGSTKSSSSASSAGNAGSSATGTGKGTGKGTGTGPGAGGKEAPVPAPKKPTKPHFPYILSVLFGPLSTTPGQLTTLTPYESLKPGQPLPSKQDARVSFERVTSDGKGAVFMFVTPPILRGSGVCLPSASECQTIDLEAGHAEQLEYIEPNGQPVAYELKVVSITKSAGASAARLKRATVKAALASGAAKAAQGLGSASSMRVWSK